MQVYNSSQSITSTVKWESIIHVPVHEAVDLVNVATSYVSEFFSGIIITLSREIEGTGILTYKLRAWNADSGSLIWERTLWQTADLAFPASKGSIMLLDVKKDQLSVPQITLLVSVSGLLLYVTTKMDSILKVDNVFTSNTQADFLFSRFVTDIVHAGADNKYKVIGSGCYGNNQICRSTIGVVLGYSDELIVHDVELPSDLPVAIHSSYLQFVNTKLSQGISGLNSMKILAFGCSIDGSSCRLLVIAFTFRKVQGVISSSVGTVVSSLVIPNLFSVNNVELLAISDKQLRVCYKVDSVERCDDVVVGNDGQVVFMPKRSSHYFERVLAVQPDVVCVAKITKPESQEAGGATTPPRWSTALHCGADVESARDAPSDFTFSLPLMKATFSADPYNHLSIIKTKSAYRLFGATLSGLVFNLQISSLLPQPVFDRVLWEKDEWPGHIAQALLLDSKQQLSQSSPQQQQQQEESAAVISQPKSFEDAMQQLSVRLSLQKQDLVVQPSHTYIHTYIHKQWKRVDDDNLLRSP